MKGKEINLWWKMRGFFSKALLKKIIDNHMFFPSHLDYEDLQFGTFKKIASEFISVKHIFSFLHCDNNLLSLNKKIIKICNEHLELFLKSKISSRQLSIHIDSSQNKSFKIIIDANRLDIVKVILKKIIDVVELMQVLRITELYLDGDNLRLTHFFVLATFYYFFQLLLCN